MTSSLPWRSSVPSESERFVERDRCGVVLEDVQRALSGAEGAPAVEQEADIPIEFDYDGEMTAAHPWGGRFDGGGTTTGYGDPTWPDGPEHYRDALCSRAQFGV